MQTTLRLFLKSNTVITLNERFNRIHESRRERFGDTATESVPEFKQFEAPYRFRGLGIGRGGRRSSRFRFPRTRGRGFQSANDRQVSRADPDAGTADDESGTQANSGGIAPHYRVMTFVRGGGTRGQVLRRSGARYMGRGMGLDGHMFSRGGRGDGDDGVRFGRIERRDDFRYFWGAPGFGNGRGRPSYRRFRGGRDGGRRVSRGGGRSARSSFMTRAYHDSEVDRYAAHDGSST